MTETIKTTTALLTELSDGAAAHSTNREKLRNAIVSFDVTRSAQVNPKDAPHLAVGNGSNDDTTPLSTAIAASAGGMGLVPEGSYLTTAATAVPANTLLLGAGRGSVLKTTTVSTHLLTVAAAGVLIRALSFLGVKGSNVLNNSAVAISGTSDTGVEDCDISGLSGNALYVTGSSYIRFFKNYIHGLTPDATYVNSCDISFFTTVSHCIAAFNRLMGGAQTEVGVILQLTSAKHLVIGNDIGAHYSYGIIDYDTTPGTTNSLIVLNRIEDIDGSTNGTGNKGAGIYTAQTGGQVIGFNQISNTNINTTAETLAPGGIGLNQAFSPVLVQGNMIWAPNWYGIIVTATTGAIVELANNHIFEPLKQALYVKSSSNVSITGGSITMLTATPLTKGAVIINVAGGGPFTNVSVRGVHIRGSSRGIESLSTNNVSICLNQISQVNGIGIRIGTGTGGIVADNNVDSTVSATDPALDISSMVNLTVKGNVFKSTFATCIRTAGTNTGSVFDESNVLVGMDMNNVDNAGTGMRFALYGTAAPTVKAHKVGDRVINSVPTVGQPKAWVCTTSGTPGTWTSEGNL